MRKIYENATKNVAVKVFKDTEWGEYIAKLYVNGTEYKPASYHTDDKQDAIDTANAMLNREVEIQSTVVIA